MSLHKGDRPLLFLLCGPPGGGKSNIIDGLLRDTSICVIGVGDLLRDEIAKGSPLGVKCKTRMEQGKLVTDELVNALVIHQLETQKVREHGAVLDGYPRTEAQALLLGEYCHNSSWWKIDALIAVEVPDEVLLDRAAGRRIDPVTHSVYHLKYKPPPSDIVHRLQIRPDDKPERQRRRIAIYRENTEPIESLFESKLVRINGNQPMKKVYEEFCIKAIPRCYGPNSNRPAFPASKIPKAYQKFYLMNSQQQQQSKL